MNYYKILDKSEKHYEMQYRIGLNINCEKFNPKGDCEPGGMYFSREDILAFLGWGPWIRQVTLCPDSKVYRNPGEPVKWKTDKFILGERRQITLEVIKELIEEGANIHADHDMAVRWASTQGHLEIVKLLIGYNAKYLSSLISASKNGHFEVVKYLVENGADVHIHGDSPLTWASEMGHLNIVKFLVNNGADIHAYNDYALKEACRNGHIEIVKYLVENGADINANNYRAIKSAFEKKHYDIVRYLINQGAAIPNFILAEISFSHD